MATSENREWRTVQRYADADGTWKTGLDLDPIEDGAFSQDGGDLYVASIPDDISMLEVRIDYEREEHGERSALVVAAMTLLAIEREFFDDEEEFHPHSDLKLRAYVMGCMQDALNTQLNKTVDREWLDDRLSVVRGFPPNSWLED